MIQVTRLSSAPGSNPDAGRSVHVIGVGGAGSNALDRLVLDGFDKSLLTVANTDAQSLTSSVASRKIQLGRQSTRGLGAGGDPDLGLTAAQEAADELNEAVDGASMLFVVAGLGGGTGSGAAPFIADIGRERGALVVAFVTMPFSFEGKRRQTQAEEALEALRSVADTVIVFENDRMGDAATASTGIHQAFANADVTLSQSIRDLSQVFQRPGLLRIGYDELASVVKGAHTTAIFAHAEADGPNRAHDVVARALKCPLLERGRLLEETGTVLVSLTGGTDLTLVEAQIVMDDLQKHLHEAAMVHLGISVDARAGDRLSVMILGGLGNPPAMPAARPQPAVRPATQPAPSPVRPSVPAPEPITDEVESEPAPATPAFSQESLIPDPEPSAVTARRPGSKAARGQESKRPGVPQQESLPFEPVSRGRFDKSEPTIIDGQDLDVPTFMRRNVRLK